MGVDLMDLVDLSGFTQVSCVIGLDSTVIPRGPWVHKVQSHHV